MSARKTIAAVLSVVCATAAVMVLASSPASAAEFLPTGVTFGSEGSGDGQFILPAGIAVNEVAIGNVGDVYVADVGNRRVERFNSKGEYLSQWNGGATAAGGFYPAFNAQGIAIDNSREPLDAAAGDVYVADTENNVIDQFTSEGVATGLEITGTCPHPGHCAPEEVIPFKFPGNVEGVSVDPAGNIWVLQGRATLDEFSDVGAFIQTVIIPRGVEGSFGLDANDDIYIVNGSEKVSKYLPGATSLDLEFGSSVRALAVLSGSNEVLVEQRNRVALYGPFAEPSAAPIEVSPSEVLSGSQGIAIDAASESKTVYASERNPEQVVILESVKFANPMTEQPSEVKESSAMLHGMIDTEGKEITECRFEYELEASFGSEPFYSEQVPCEQTPTEINALSNGGTESVAVSAELNGLSPRSNYHVRLTVATAASTRTAAGIEFYTSTAPYVLEESVTNVASTGATVHATIASGGLASGYRVEYGPTAAFGSSTQEVNIGAPKYPVTVEIPLSGLDPGVEYHFRVVAANTLGSGAGAASTFTTAGNVGPTSSILSDGRVIELVSPGEGSQNVYDPTVGEGGAGNDEHVETKLAPMRAAAGGDAIAYAGEPSPEGGNGAFGDGQANQLMSNRTADGWVTQDITPEGTNSFTRYGYFSDDLTIGILGSVTPVMSASPPGPSGCNALLYSRDSASGDYHSLFTETTEAGVCGKPLFAGMSATGSHMLFSIAGALTAGAHPGNKSEESREREENLYDTVDGVVHQVNISPDGQPEAAPDASFGSSGEVLPDLSNDVSVDGSRVFWTSSVRNEEDRQQFVPRALYVRENDETPQSPLGPGGECSDSADACTVQLDLGERACVLAGKCESGGGRYWGASTDGSRVFFTDCAKLTADSTAVPGKQCLYGEESSVLAGSDLYEYNFGTAKLTDLTIDRNGDPLGADVQGVLGISEDGDYVYFAASGVLASGANAQSCQSREGSCNLYEWHNGEVSFLGTLLRSDNNLPPLSGAGNAGPRGDWRGSMGERTAETTPDGKELVFTSTSPLTGYANEGHREVYVYNAVDKDMVCASCDPSGAPPSVGGPTGIGSYLPPMLSTGQGPTFMPRWVSRDGSRVFFDSEEPLVAQDENGAIDVYEWERGGTGSCATGAPKGCIYLLSGGQSSDNSFLIDADATGENVFFTSREGFVPQSRGRVVLYDARVGGGFPEVSIACTGTGCQGVPPAPPIFATPSSATFAGVGNFPPQAKPAAKRRSKPTARCRKGFVKKRGRCMRKVKKARKVRTSAGRSNGRGR